MYTIDLTPNNSITVATEEEFKKAIEELAENKTGYIAWHCDDLVSQGYVNCFTGKYVIDTFGRCEECDMLTVLSENVCSQCLNLAIHNSGLS